MTNLEIITSILNDKMGIDSSKITMETTFDDLNLDSLDLVELICAYEDETGKDFGDPEGLKTVKDLCDYMDTL